MCSSVIPSALGRCPHPPFHPPPPTFTDSSLRKSGCRRGWCGMDARWNDNNAPTVPKRQRRFQWRRSIRCTNSTRFRTEQHRSYQNRIVIRCEGYVPGHGFSLGTTAQRTESENFLSLSHVAEWSSMTTIIRQTLLVIPSKLSKRHRRSNFFFFAILCSKN